VDRKQLTTGSILIVIGLIFLAGRLSSQPELFGLHRLWPAILIAMGVVQLMSPADDHHRPGRRAGGLWFVFLGGLFLLHTYGILLLSQSWPLFIVWAGVGMLTSRRRLNVPPDGTR
jgi:hypothetical protein